MTARATRHLIGRASWNLADQVVSSGTNLLLSILVARALTAEGFGAFAIAFTIYSFLVAAGRSLISQPLVVRFLAKGDEAFRAAAQSAAGAATLLGLVSGAVTGVAGLAIGGPVGVSLLCIGLLMPGLLLQDMWRAIFIAQGRPAAALVNDVVWAVAQFTAVIAVISLGRDSSSAMLIAWGGAALLAAVVGGFQFGTYPRPIASPRWLWGQRDLLGYYAASFLSVMGASQVTLLLIGALGTPADVGALRAAQVVLGPLNLLGYSISAFVLPELSRRQLSGRVAIKAAVAVSAVMVAAGCVWGLALLVLPDGVGTALLGDSWSAAQDVLPASLLGALAIGSALGASQLMVSRGYARETFFVQSLLAPGFLVLGLVGLELWGAPGAALGLSLTQVVVAPVMWWQVVRLMRRERPVPGPEKAPVPPVDPARGRLP